MGVKLGFIGAGNMAEAIARAAIEHGVVPAADMVAYDPTAERRELFKSLGVAVADGNEGVIRGAEHVLLAVKPQVMSGVAKDLATYGNPGQVIVSIMAGITSTKLEGAIGRRSRIVRVMPNTPMMAGLGMAGIALGEGAKDGDEELAVKLFSAGGSKAIRVDEAMIDAITAVSGSGPAYVFYLAEAMEKAAQDLGLGEHARLLVSQTILGAAKLLSESPDNATELRRKVTSPGGTTQAAIEHMEGKGVLPAIVEAIAAAERRSKELGA